MKRNRKYEDKMKIMAISFIGMVITLLIVIIDSYVC